MVKRMKRRATCDLKHMNALALVVCVFLLLAPLLPPSPSVLFNWHGGVLVEPFRIWRYAAIAVIVVFYFLIGNGKKPLIAGVVVLAGLMLLSTWVCDGSKRDCVYDWSAYIAAVFLVDAIGRYRWKELLQGILAVTVFMSLLNIVSALLFPDGIYEYCVYFYGNRNIAYQLSFLIIACTLLLGEGLGKRMGVWSFMLPALALLQIVLTRSATSCIATVFLCIVLAAIHWRSARKVFNGMTMIAISGILFVLVVIFRVSDHFAPFVTGVLGKSLSFSGRTDIWDLMFELFDGWHAWLGYGVSGNSLIWANGIHYNHAHNMYLDVWFMAGIAALVVFIIILLLAAFRLYKMRYRPGSAILAAVLGAYLIVGLSEPMTRVSFFVFLALCYSLPSQGANSAGHNLPSSNEVNY